MNHIDKMQDHLKSISKSIQFLIEKADHLAEPKDLEQLTTYEEMQDAISKMYEALSVLIQGSIHLNKGAIQ